MEKSKRTNNESERLMTFTPTETKIMNVIWDGAWHPRDEILDNVDPYMELVTLCNHITNIRRKLEKESKDIVVRRRNGVYCYRIMRHLVPDE